jgi:hypothetical protein
MRLADAVIDLHSFIRTHRERLSRQIDYLGKIHRVWTETLRYETALRQIASFEAPDGAVMRSIAIRVLETKSEPSDWARSLNTILDLAQAQMDDHPDSYPATRYKLAMADMETLLELLRPPETSDAS